MNDDEVEKEIELDALVPAEEELKEIEIEEIVEKATTAIQEKKDGGYAITPKICPQCSVCELEEQTFGYEKTTFCPQCDYSVTRDI